MMCDCITLSANVETVWPWKENCKSVRQCGDWKEGPKWSTDFQGHLIPTDSRTSVATVSKLIASRYGRWSPVSQWPGKGPVLVTAKGKKPNTCHTHNGTVAWGLHYFTPQDRKEWSGEECPFDRSRNLVRLRVRWGGGANISRLMTGIVCLWVHFKLDI